MLILWSYSHSVAVLKSLLYDSDDIPTYRKITLILGGMSVLIPFL